MPVCFEDLWQRWDWRPIKNCPGRYVLNAGGPPPDLAGLLGVSCQATALHSPAAADPILVHGFADGGVISYCKPDGSYVHTLNTREGFRRKLVQLGLDKQVR